MLAEGTQGYLTGAAIDRFGLHGRNPQVWALGVKEVWRVPKPLRKVIHTMGWPLRGGKRYREFGGSFIYPMGERPRLARHGRRPRLPRRLAVGARPPAGAEDAQARTEDPRRRRACRLGGEDDSGGRLLLASLEAPRARRRLLRRRGRLRERARAQGHPLRGRVGRAGRRGDRRRAPSGRGDRPLRRAVRLRRRGPPELRHEGPETVRNMRQAFAKGFWIGSAKAGVDDGDGRARAAEGAPHRARLGSGADSHRPCRDAIRIRTAS